MVDANQFPEMPAFLKDPSAKVPFTEDWTDWLVGSDTIASVVWTVPDGITKDSDWHDVTTATVWLEGGARGQDYIIAGKVTTVGGLIDERSFIVQVRDR